MNNPKYLWIQTRDGSPTLWSNELGESFRSVKGAFVESWVAFVSPALTFIADNFQQKQQITVGEFGLGPGTNWLLMSVAASYLDVEIEYHAIEKDQSSFVMGVTKWNEIFDEVQNFVSQQLNVSKAPLKIESLKKPIIHPTLQSALFSVPSISANIWFHDPFGFDVNPDGYSAETISQCSSMWNPNDFWGGSYACNRHFFNSLKEIENITVERKLTGNNSLKRERLEFWRDSK